MPVSVAVHCDDAARAEGKTVTTARTAYIGLALVAVDNAPGQATDDGLASPPGVVG